MMTGNLTIELVKVGDAYTGRTFSDRWNVATINYGQSTIVADRNQKHVKTLRRDNPDCTIVVVRGARPVVTLTSAESDAVSEGAEWFAPILSALPIPTSGSAGRPVKVRDGARDKWAAFHPSARLSALIGRLDARMGECERTGRMGDYGTLATRWGRLASAYINAAGWNAYVNADFSRPTA